MSIYSSCKEPFATTLMVDSLMVKPHIV